MNFEHRFTRLMSSFVEEAQLYFLQLRHVCEHFWDSITDAVSRFISTKLAQNDLDAVPQELRMCIDDRESLVNLVDAMKATHIARIEEREDRMATRSKEFISYYVEKLNK